MNPYFTKKQNREKFFKKNYMYHIHWWTSIIYPKFFPLCSPVCQLLTLISVQINLYQDQTNHFMLYSLNFLILGISQNIIRQWLQFFAWIAGKIGSGHFLYCSVTGTHSNQSDCMSWPFYGTLCHHRTFRFIPLPSCWASSKQMNLCFFLELEIWLNASLRTL